MGDTGGMEYGFKYIYIFQLVKMIKKSVNKA